jgi:hypothetical protein
MIDIIEGVSHAERAALLGQEQNRVHHEKVMLLCEENIAAAIRTPLEHVHFERSVRESAISNIISLFDI